METQLWRFFMCVTKVNIFRSNSAMTLFISLCLKKNNKKTPSPVGCAIQLCAPLTDWNIPHRGLASFLLDSCLSARRKTIFDNCSLFINWWKWAVHVWMFCTRIGYFTILFIGYVMHMLGCQFHLVSQTSTHFYFYAGIFHSYATRYRTVEAYGAHENGVWLFLWSQPVRLMYALSFCLSFYVQPLILTDFSWIKSDFIGALCVFFFLTTYG